MSTTTLRIEPALRERITQLAHALNQTPHSFMLEALAEKADEAEWKLSMQREAQHRYPEAAGHGDPSLTRRGHGCRASLAMTWRLHASDANFNTFVLKWNQLKTTLLSRRR